MADSLARTRSPWPQVEEWPAVAGALSLPRLIERLQPAWVGRSLVTQGGAARVHRAFPPRRGRAGRGHERHPRDPTPGWTCCELRLKGNYMPSKEVRFAPLDWVCLHSAIAKATQTLKLPNSPSAECWQSEG